MHSTVIIVESMSATSSRRRRPACGWTTTSTPGNSPSRRARTPSALSSRRSQALPSSTHRCVAAKPRASVAAEISPRLRRSFAIRVAMNPESTGKPPLAVIAGPTASGKSAVALALAEHSGGGIINARPTPEDEARAAHRLYGYRDGADACSMAAWAADARAEIEAAQAAERLPILCGGTGLYLRTLIEGIAPVPEIDPAVRAAVRALARGEAHQALVQE